MNYDDFVIRVQDRLDVSQEQALKIIEACLETLGERLYRTEREKFAAQLPAQLKKFILKRIDNDRYNLEEFYKRVGARAGMRQGRGAETAQAVMAVVREAITPGELEYLGSHLPDEYEELWMEK
ncbi:MAG: DUF2267 domain-containing protein [Syntrophales bacterium]|jgi:uncharacterized protein (DUF2267 family)|nr:DUF2267 domain-containing protein [Syntrophales bacterium]MDY0043672.1 DUF2267 domain-containing protein [Syntrophales bacterium]